MPPLLTVSRRLLLSRLLTRLGDQAWEFAVPVSIAILFPDALSLVAALFLFNKLGVFLLQPVVAQAMDRWSRLSTSLLGISMQACGVFVASVCLYALALRPDIGSFILNSQTNQWLPLVGVSIGSVTASLGAGLMDIAVGQDWLPHIAPENRLTHLNAQLKRIDLATEILAPALAGLLFALTASMFPLTGFLIVALWNLVSFVPEFFLLRSVFRSSPRLAKSSVTVPKERTRFFLSGLMDGWRTLFQHPSALSVVAYSCLWVSVLSPHGVLLTTFLKGSWQASEAKLGLFRGAGAIFGLAATFLFPSLNRKFGLVQTTRFFIIFEASVLLLSLPFFFLKTGDGYLFLFFILLSRVGLYGFSIGETEIRQRTIAAGQRGLVNGTAASLNSVATLLIFLIAALIPSQEQFYRLVIVSVAFVSIGSVCFQVWSRRTNLDRAPSQPLR